MVTVVNRFGVGLVLVASMAGCGDPLAGALGLPRVVDRQPHPDDRRVSFDGIDLSADKRTVTVRFTGGKPYHPDEPCSTDYTGVGVVRDNVLEISVIETVSQFEGVPEQRPDGGPLVGCTAEGHPRTVGLQLPEPFLGSKVLDLTGYTRFLSAPDGLVELAGLPAAWTLRSENDVGESPTGRWQRHYAPSDQPPGEDGRGALDLFQAFGGPVNVTGGEETRSVQVGDAVGTLYRQPASGELVLTWDLDGIGLALVAHEHDFAPEALIELAASAALPPN